MTTPAQLLSESEIELIAACLKAAEEGPFFPDWEFQTLFGIERAELAAVRRHWPKVSLGDEKPYLAVMNSIANLLGYPHGEEDALQKFVPGGRKVIGQLGHKLVTLPAPGTAFRGAIPNGETVSAMEELDAGGGRVSKAATGEVFGRAVKKRS